jgi:dihydrofolate reductase
MENFEMRKVELFIAMSLDGYVARVDGDVSWLGGQDPDNQSMGSYDEFIKNIDTIVMGYTTYHQIVTELSADEWVYAGMKSYVLTHRNIENRDDITFVNQDVKSLIDELKKQEGKNIWICGGPDVVNQLIKDELIDRYTVTVIPTILGRGIRLFYEENNEIKLKLIKTETNNGMVDLVYERIRI